MQKLIKDKIEVKICGITRQREINIVNELDIDYIGFVFAKSKREVSTHQAEELMSNLKSTVKKVAVLVNPTIQKLSKIQSMDFDVIQIHGNIPVEAVEHINVPIWKAVHVTNKVTKEMLDDSQLIEGYVFDNKQAGSGETFNWDLIKGMTIGEKKVILAGGLNSDNVVKGIVEVNPHIVDVSSGVEGTNGKDKDLTKKFIKRVRQYNE